MNSVSKETYCKLGGVALAMATLAGWRKLPRPARMAGLASALLTASAAYAFKKDDSPLPAPAADPIETAARAWPEVTEIPTRDTMRQQQVRGPGFVACLVKVEDTTTFFKTCDPEAFAEGNPIGIWGVRDDGKQFGAFTITDQLNFITTGKDGPFVLATVEEVVERATGIEMQRMERRIAADGDTRKRLSDGFALRLRGPATDTHRHPVVTVEWHQNGSRWPLSDDAVRRICAGEPAEGYRLDSEPRQFEKEIATVRQGALEKMQAAFTGGTLTELPDGRRQWRVGGRTFEEQYVDSPIWRLGALTLIDDQGDDATLKAWLKAQRNRDNAWGQISDRLQLQLRPKLTPPDGYVWGTLPGEELMTSSLMWMEQDGKQALLVHVQPTGAGAPFVQMWHQEGGLESDWVTNLPDQGVSNTPDGWNLQDLLEGSLHGYDLVAKDSQAPSWEQIEAHLGMKKPWSKLDPAGYTWGDTVEALPMPKNRMVMQHADGRRAFLVRHMGRRLHVLHFYEQAPGVWQNASTKSPVQLADWVEMKTCLDSRPSTQNLERLRDPIGTARRENWSSLTRQLHAADWPTYNPPAGYLWGSEIDPTSLPESKMIMEQEGSKALLFKVEPKAGGTASVLMVYEVGDDTATVRSSNARLTGGEQDVVDPRGSMGRGASDSLRYLCSGRWPTHRIVGERDLELRRIAAKRDENWASLNRHLTVTSWPKYDPPAGYDWGSAIDDPTSMDASKMIMEQEGKRAILLRVKHKTTGKQFIQMFYEKGGDSAAWVNNHPRDGVISGDPVDDRGSMDIFGLLPLRDLNDGRHSTFELV